jgi:hypothetical protein
MKNTKELPSYEELKRMFTYEPSTGVLRWNYREEMTGQWNGRFAGQIAGSREPGGYTKVTINDVNYQAHRIIWMLCNAFMPAGMEIDHINGKKSDNRIANLRLATTSQNQCNRKADSNRKLPKNIYRHKTKFRHEININGVRYASRAISTLEEAVEQAVKVEKLIQGDYAVHNRGVS